MDITTALPSGRDADSLAAERQLEQMYRQQFGKVSSYFRRCGSTDAEARELAQDCFLRAYRGLAGFRGESQFGTWFWAIVQRVWIDHLRRSGPVMEATDPDDLPALQTPRGSNAATACKKASRASPPSIPTAHRRCIWPQLRRCRARSLPPCSAARNMPRTNT